MNTLAFTAAQQVHGLWGN